MSQTHYFTRDVPMDEVAGNRPAGGQSMAKFYAGQVEDKAKSEALGRPAYRTIDMVQIIIPGDNGTVVKRRVKPSDKQRWPKQWEAYEKMQEYIPEGTLIDNWPRLTRGQIEDLKYNNVFTVEQLAELPDEALGRLGLGARRMREHAKAFIEAAANGAPSAHLVEENERMKNQVSLLTAQVADLIKKIEIYAGKAGEKVEDIDLEAPGIMADEISGQKAKASKTVIDIPDDFEDMTLVQLRALCSKITDEKVLSKAHAIDVINEYRGVE